MADSSVHRVIKAGDKGADVRRLQQGLNKIVDDHEFDWRRITVDGENGDLTKKIAHLAAFAIGLSEDQVKQVAQGTFTQHAQKHLRRDVERSAAMKKRSKDRELILKKLRAEHRRAIEESKDKALIVTFDGKPCAKWIAEYLQLARDKYGWTGYLVSGFRTPEYSESLCYARCGQPSCPGTCAGRSSNHSCPSSYTCKEYEGAVDLSDYDRFGQIAAANGWPLKNDLPADRVHYSNGGH